ncbi:Predicted PurR-regulated permease PerM [Caloramator quimbayensis]|uniref:Predicted PurR-regulated permease PerM n=1 Tax=Caloramator quimbayensis TaxID=1147123 RepID=A0A1T4WWC9_9CLOT|nr:AI-2E family transporter [Caloramator quimbayensis]SKA81670.1 Predicted PurR-regulated permease PerM [Caloramator quimbayensis]
MLKMNSKKLFVIFFFIVLIILAYFSRSILKPILFSILIAYIVNPFVNYLIAKGVNKKIAVILSLLILFLFAFLLIIIIVPGIVKDVLSLLQNADEYRVIADKYKNSTGYNVLPQYMRSAVDSSILKVQLVITDYLKRFFNQIIDFSMELPTYILMPVFVYYFLADKDYLLSFIKSFIPYNERNKVLELGSEIDKVIGGFIKSQIILSIVIFILTFVAMVVLKIKYPLIIAFVNGIANIIPYFGPIIGFLPAFLSASAQSINKAVIVAIVFFIIQEFESGIIAPKLMGESLGIHPVFIMVILLIGGKFFGAWGLILSIPIAGVIKVTYNYIIKSLY